MEYELPIGSAVHIGGGILAEELEAEDDTDNEELEGYESVEDAFFGYYCSGRWKTGRKNEKSGVCGAHLNNEKCKGKGLTFH